MLLIPQLQHCMLRISQINLANSSLYQKCIPSLNILFSNKRFVFENKFANRERERENEEVIIIYPLEIGARWSELLTSVTSRVRSCYLRCYCCSNSLSRTVYERPSAFEMATTTDESLE